MVELKIFGTEIDLNWGSFIHIVFGLLAVFLRQEWLFTIIFLFKQGVDLFGGEASSECSGDVAEYCIGLVTGLLLRLILGGRIF
jgi:hypothetical protein